MRFTKPLVLLAFAGVSVSAQPAPRPATPVAVELFTSQGCSSCPPADALLEALARQPNVIAITRPVTYWDRLGWKDTLAREDNTQLQRAYASKGHGGAGVYTPQAVVQGVDAAVGSDRAALARLISAEKARPGPGIAASVAADGGRSVQISGAAGVVAAISILALKGDVMVRIGNGENGGRSVRYTNVVVSESVVGQWRGGAQTIAVPASAFKVSGADRYAIIIQQPGGGRILAARYI